MKKVELNNAQVESILKGIQDLKTSGISLSGMAMYDIVRNTRQLENEFNLYAEARAEVLKRYGTLDEGGETITVAPEHLADANKELKEMALVVNEYELYEIPSKVLKDISISFEAMLALECMIK